MRTCRGEHHSRSDAVLKMESTVFLLLAVFISGVTKGGAVTCDFGWHEFNNNCYFVSYPGDSWVGGSGECHQMGYDMVVITDQATNNFVASLGSTIGNSHYESVWIGLNDRTVEDMFFWNYYGRQPTYENWDGGKPNNDEDEDCVELNLSSKKWKVASCDIKKHYVCQKYEGVTDGGAVTCDSGSQEFNNNCYFISAFKDPWSLGKFECGGTSYGMVVITDQATNNFVASLGYSIGHSHEDLWIGLNDIYVENEFQWEDGRQLTYENWNDGQPENSGFDDDCVLLNVTSKKWDVKNCDLNRHYVCQQYAGPVTTPRPPTFAAPTTASPTTTAPRPTTPSEGADFLLFSSNADIFRHFINSGQDENLYHSKSDLIEELTVAIDFDWVRNSLYWSDNQGKIFKYSLDTGVHDVIADDIGKASGLAFDWRAGNLYWTDLTMKRIEMARYDGQYRRVLIKKIEQQPRSITLDPPNGKMYWIDQGDNSCIMQADMDGLNAVAIIDTDLGTPLTLTIDHDTQMMYWSDLTRGQIETANLDGGNRRVILSVNSSFTSVVPAVAIYKNDLYWVEEFRSVMKANKVTGEEKITVLSGTGGLVCLKVVRYLSPEGHATTSTFNPDVTTAAPYEVFRCSDGRNIPSAWTCDRVLDCFHGDDELMCGLLK